MPSLAVWTFLAFALLQGYAAAWLLPRRGQPMPWPRLFLGLLFLFNALVASLSLVIRLGWSGQFPVDALDACTNGLLVLAAEAVRASVMRRPMRVFAGPFAAFVTVAPAALPLVLPEMPPAFTLLAYGYAALVLAETALRAGPDTKEAQWMPWLLAAFAPRIAEFTVGFAWLPGGASAWAAPLQAAALLAMAVGLAGVLLHLSRTRRTALALPTAVLIVVGLTLGYLRLTNSAAVGEPMVIQFTLGAVRPMVVLAALASVGLFGVRAPGATLLHDGVVMAGSGASAAASFLVVPSLLLTTAPGVVVPLAGVLALASVPVWSWLAQRWQPSYVRHGAVEAGTPALPSAPSVPAHPRDSRPGLDPACRFDAAAFARYDAAEEGVRSLPRKQAAALAALNRGQRMLLALRGSSSGSIGTFEYSQAGLQLATHIPYKHIAGVVRAVNEGKQGKVPLIASSTGVRGTRYYWLTERGAEAAAQLAHRVALGDQADAAWLGEAFHRAGAPELRK